MSFKRLLAYVVDQVVQLFLMSMSDDYNINMLSEMP